MILFNGQEAGPMSKGEQAMHAFWNVFSKRMWLDGIRMKECLGDYHPSEIHCIEYIANHTDSNVTKLSEFFNMTRSAVSKLTKKMIAKSLIESYQRPENKKEIYFSLTAQGEVINSIHETIHREYQERDKAVFAQGTKEQFQAMLDFATVYNEHLDREIEKYSKHHECCGPDRL